MNLSNVLSLIGGLCLFLFGMQIMGNYLEKTAGSKLGELIRKLTTGKIAGFLTGLGVTSVIQSSSATTVMVVGFVNSGVMTLTQAINVIMGANVGTTVTAWILSLTGIDSSNVFVSMLKPSNFTPILAVFGIYLFMFCKSDKKKDIGAILLGFATLMFGMDTMSASVSGLKDIPEFQRIMISFSSPVLGVITGAVITGIIQSSSASVGILQALSTTGQVTIGTSIPIIMGQNIGTCVTAMLSSVGANKNARRAAIVHLFFNIIGCVIFLSLYVLLNSIFGFAFVKESANAFSIAVIHSVFNISCTMLLLPFSNLLEKLAFKLLPEKGTGNEEETFLDERLLDTPSFAIESCRALSMNMAKMSFDALKISISNIDSFTKEIKDKVKKSEEETDKYEDMIGSYLVKLSAKDLSKQDSNEVTKILHMIGDFERISDHAVNILESAEEIKQKEFKFTLQAKKELDTLIKAVAEISRITFDSFVKNDEETAKTVEPLEQVIDSLKSQIRSRHILRLRAGDCSLDAGFVLSDLLTNLERTADHCSNIAGCIIEMKHSDLDIHNYLDDLKHKDKQFKEQYEAYKLKYVLP